jgi:hypothetical protein
MNLKQLSETISCNHINFLNKKYDLHNSRMFNNQMKCNQANNLYDDRTLLKSVNVCKKSCTFEPPVITDKNKVDNYTVDYLNTISSIPVMFDINTRIKTVL